MYFITWIFHVLLQMWGGMLDQWAACSLLQLPPTVLWALSPLM